MAMERNMRVGACFLAVALVGAAGTLNAHARSHHAHYTKHGSQPAAADTGVRATKGLDHSPGETGPASKTRDFKAPDNPVTQDNPGSKQIGGRQELKGSASGPRGDGVNTAIPTDDRTVTKGANTIDAQGRDASPIDTRITTVQPRRPNGRPDKFRQAKMVRIAPRKSSLPRQPGLAAPNRVARNAIGAIVVRHDQGRAGGPDRGKIPGPAPTTMASLGKTNLSPEPRVMPQPKLIPPGNTNASNHGALNGTGLVRLGSGPGVLGGPAKTVSGIGGNMFKPKH